ncbi:hypothetical protein ACFX15_013671 [Malus domestica]
MELRRPGAAVEGVDAESAAQLAPGVRTMCSRSGLGGVRTELCMSHGGGRQYLTPKVASSLSSSEVAAAVKETAFGGTITVRIFRSDGVDGDEVLEPKERTARK